MLNFRGTSLEQDSRFGDRDKKLEGKIKFPAEFDTKVRRARDGRVFPLIVRQRSVARPSCSHLMLVCPATPLFVAIQVDMKKVKLEILKPWIVQQVVHYMQTEDDVLIGLIFNLLETAQFPDPRKMQVQLTGFLERNTKTLMLDLWRLMLSAQSNELGIPEEFLEQKKRELMEQQVLLAGLRTNFP